MFRKNYSGCFFGKLVLLIGLLCSCQLSQQAMAEGSTAIKAPAIDALIEPLRQKLQANPDDVGNWVLLAQSYDYLGRYEESRDALAHAQALGYQAPAGATPVPPQNAIHRQPTDPLLMQWMAEEAQRPLPTTGSTP
jgi:hypothetical protein